MRGNLFIAGTGRPIVSAVQVRGALAHKVSRERIGSELHGMFTGGAGLRMQASVPLSHACSIGDKGKLRYLHLSTRPFYSGPDPVRAVRDIQRLRLFPVVFAPPDSLVAILGEGYGAQCSRVMAAAASTLTAWGAEVWCTALQCYQGFLMRAGALT